MHHPLLALPLLANLVTSATLSPRPLECRRSATGQGIWDEARAPERENYCDSLSRGNARLTDAPALARVEAERASELAPTRAAPHVLRARVLLRQGDASSSHAAFKAAMALDSRALDAPVVLWDAANAARRSGAHIDALILYRRLVPMAEHLGDRRAQVRVLLEAGHVSMRAAEPEGAKALDEALSLLRAAAQMAVGRERVEAALSLALCLDRSGRMDLANGLLLEARGLARWARAASADHAVSDEDRIALRALALAQASPSEAQALLASLLEGVVPGAWRSVLAVRLERLALPKPKASGKRR